MKVGSDIGALTALSFGLAQNDSRPDGHNGPDPLEDLLSTPSIRSLDPVREYGKPTKVERIPGRIFAFALLELAKIGGSDDADSIERKLRQVASDYPNSPVGTFLETIAGTVGNDIDRYLNLTSSWFDQQMTRLTEIYRKNARWVLFIIGCVAALTFNIDALEVGHALRDDSNLRAGVLLIADDVAKDGVLGQLHHRRRRDHRSGISLRP